MGFEPTTSCLGSKHSTTELRPLEAVNILIIIFQGQPNGKDFACRASSGSPVLMMAGSKSRRPARAELVRAFSVSVGEMGLNSP